MPDENRFAGLSDQEDDPSNDEEPTNDDNEGTNEPLENVDSEGGPAFEFDVTTAKSIYVREETLALLEDTEFEVESVLRRKHDIRDVTGREFHDAMVRVMIEHVDEIAAQVDSERNS